MLLFVGKNYILSYKNIFSKNVKYENIKYILFINIINGNKFYDFCKMEMLRFSILHWIFNILIFEIVSNESRYKVMIIQQLYLKVIAE